MTVDQANRPPGRHAPTTYSARSCASAQLRICIPVRSRRDQPATGPGQPATSRHEAVNGGRSRTCTSASLGVCASSPLTLGAGRRARLAIAYHAMAGGRPTSAGGES